VPQKDTCKKKVITKQLGDTNSIRDIEKYRLQWRNHLERMEDTQLPKTAFCKKIQKEKRNSKTIEKKVQPVLSTGTCLSGLILGKTERRRRKTSLFTC
jgi:hypothetical protein